MQLSLLEQSRSGKVMHPKFTISRGETISYGSVLDMRELPNSLHSELPSCLLIGLKWSYVISEPVTREENCDIVRQSSPLLELPVTSFLFETHDYTMATCMEEEDIAEQNHNSFWKIGQQNV